MRRLVDRHPGEADEIAPRARDLGEMDGLVAEPALGERIHAVAVVGRARIERVGNQHGVVERRDFDAAPGEDVPVEFDVLADLHDARVFEQRLEQADRLRFVDLAGQKTAAAEEIGGARAMADRNVAGFARRHRERDADEIGLLRIERSGFGVEGYEPRFERARNPAFEFGRARHRRVGRDVDSFLARPSGPLGGETLGRPFAGGHSGGSGGRSGRGGGRSGRSRGRRGVRRDGLAVARAPAARTDKTRVGLDRIGVEPANLADAARDRSELHRLEERDQRRAL